MLYEFKDEIALAITFDYGSTQNGRERVCAITHCQRLGIKHLIIPLEFMHRYFKSALLGSPEDIPDGNYNDENMKSTVVPFRNGIMLAIACGIAESNGLKRRSCGIAFSAASPLADCFSQCAPSAWCRVRPSAPRCS